MPTFDALGMVAADMAATLDSYRLLGLDIPDDADGEGHVEVFARVTAAGHAAREVPFDAFWGQRYATVLDPDGTPVELYAALEGEPER